MGEYIPHAPVNDEAKKHNQNLPGEGGVFNTVNLHVYHYAGNNPVKYTDPDGKYSWDTFKKDLKHTFNFDFGNDYINFAAENWKNGDYFSAGLCAVDAVCEMIIDVGVAHLAAKGLGTIVYGGEVTLGASSAGAGVEAAKYVGRKSQTLYNFSKAAGSHMLNPQRRVPIQILDEVIKKNKRTS